MITLWLAKWLAKAIGVERLTNWTLRLIQLGLLLALLAATVAALSVSETVRKAAIALAALGLGLAVFRVLWARRPKVEAEAGERTIDGKVVPEKLAAAALGIPAQSPDGDYVLRGLPDYGKVLLKLNTADFAYVPEPPEKVPEPPIEEPTVNRPSLGVPRWVMATGAAALLVVAGVVFYQAPHPPAAPPDAASAQASSQQEKAQQTQAPRGADAASAQAGGQQQAKTPEPTKADLEAFLTQLTQADAASAKASGQQEKAQQPEADLPDLRAKASGQQQAKTPEPTKADLDARRIKAVGEAALAELRGQMAGLLTWTDAETGRAWTTNDNGPEPIKYYDGAERYCKSLVVSGLTGWRLPSFDELSNVWNRFGERFFRATFQLSQPNEALWTSTIAPDDGVLHLLRIIGQIPTEADVHSFSHALCVRDPFQPKR